MAYGGVADEERGEAFGDAAEGGLEFLGCSFEDGLGGEGGEGGSFRRASRRRRCRQTRARAAFQLHTATGKLKAEMIPTTPRGCQVSIMRCLARSEGTVSPASWRESPAAKVQMSIISWTSPWPSERILPVSMVTRRAEGGEFGAEFFA